MADVSTITKRQIAKLLGITPRSVARIAAKENWPFLIRKGSGGNQKDYILDEVPKKVRHLYYKYSTERPSPSLSTVPVPAPKSPSLTTMDGSQREKFAAKTDLLLHYLRTLDAAGHGNKAKARENFVLAYNSGLILQQIHSVLGEVSWKTIEGWKRTLRDGGSLSDQRGKWKRGQSIVTAKQARILLEVALHPNALLVTEIIREATQRMAAAGIDNGHSPSTYRRWLQDFKTHNYDIWCFQRGGKKRWNDECCLAIERDPDLIRVGDVLVADGHKLNFNILNPWTGKPQRMILITFFDMRSNYPCGWEIMPTENTAAISAALRRAILVLGKIPRVVYLDNGRAFKAKYFENTDLEQSGLHGLYQQLGIQTVFAWAYHGQSKTVERFFGTLAELERKSPSYTGTSIEKKPPRLNRGEKLHRKVYEKVVGGETVTLEMAHRVVATWFDEYVSRPQPRSKYLKGWAPKDLFELERGEDVDPVALTALMWAKKDAVIRASRISHMGRYYYHDELYGRHHKVEVRYDLQDPGYIAVYEDGNFLCMAPEQDQVHPMANYLGTDQDRELLSQYCEIKRRQEKIAGGLSRKLLESEILPAHQKRLARDGVTATGPVKEPEPKKLTKADERLIEKEADRYFKDQDRETPNPFIGLDQLDEPDRYEQLVRYDARGVMIPKKWAAFMRYFEQTPQYRRLEENGYWEQVRTNEIVMTEAM